MQLLEVEFVLFPNAFNNIIMNNFSHFPISKVYLFQRKKKGQLKREKKSSYDDTKKRGKNNLKNKLSIIVNYKCYTLIHLINFL